VACALHPTLASEKGGDLEPVSLSFLLSVKVHAGGSCGVSQWQLSSSNLGGQRVLALAVSGELICMWGSFTRKSQCVELGGVPAKHEASKSQGIGGPRSPTPHPKHIWRLLLIL
jgi:hypothetical protein